MATDSEIGRVVAVETAHVSIELNRAFFGKHAAILGSTGSGKSCTIASILQSIRLQPAVKRMTCIILDTNGEYRSAFQTQKKNGSWADAGPGRCLYIPSDSGKKADRLVIPYWFMDAEDFARLFQASKGVQRPVLLEGPLPRAQRHDTRVASNNPTRGTRPRVQPDLVSIGQG